jgi:replication factor C large subunit
MEHILWTDKYRPKNPDEIAGGKKPITEIEEWLSAWKKGRGLLLHGPTGTGKGMSVEMIAEEIGYHLFKLDASDNRKSASIDSLLPHSKSVALFHKGKIILIDEVDSVSSRDRGAIGSIAKLIKESDCPVILIANDHRKPKLKPLKNCCTYVKFTRVPTQSIANRLADICKDEGIGVKGDVLKNLARWSQGDMRSAITDLHILSHGKKEIGDSDLEILGYRERENPLYNIIPTILHSGNIGATRNAIYNSDTDPDEIFWWIETNLPAEISSTEKRAQAYDILSKANILRNAVFTRQNWRLKGFMVDLLSGISLFTDPQRHGFVSYKPPQRFITLGRTKFKRALKQSACRKIGDVTHTSGRRAKSDILPYLTLIANNAKNKNIEEMAEYFDLNEEEAGLLTK